MAEARSPYGAGAVYGSLAYDFDHPDLAWGEEYAEPRTPAAKPKPQTRTRVLPRSQRAVHTKQGIAPTAILGVLVAALLFVICITAQVQLLSVSSDSVALESRLRELKTEQTKLRIRYESAFNLSEIEDYAVKDLGMMKPNAAQINYIDTSSPDRAVLIESGNGDGIVDRVADFLSGLGEYFR